MFVHDLRRLTAARLEMVIQGPTPDEARLIGEHFAYLKAACASGDVLVFGRTANSDAETMGLCIFKAASEEAAHAFMLGDPAVRGGVMAARLFPYRVAGFSADGADLSCAVWKTLMHSKP